MSETVPEGWRFNSIAECCEILDSQRIPLNSEERSKRLGEYPYYGANGIQGYIDDFIFDGDAILVAEDGGNFDQYAERPIAQWVTGKYWVNNHAHILRAKENDLDKWIFYSLVHKNILKFINGGTRAKLNQSDLREIQISLPPLPEQKKIASILTSVDEVIETTQKQIDKLQDLKKATMNELLTKGIGHTEFKDSELGRIPKSWEVKRLSDIASSDRYSIAGGPFGSDLTSKHYSENGVPVIRGSNLSDPSGKLYEQGFVFVSELKANELHRNLAKRGDFVFTQRGTMGQVAYIPNESRFNSYVVSQSQMKLSPNDAIIDPQFLLFWVTSEYFLRCIEAETIATGLPHINLGILKNLPIKSPQLSEQRLIAKKMQGVKKLIEKKREYLFSIVQLKKSLMQDLLTGKVRVQVH